MLLDGDMLRAVAENHNYTDGGREGMAYQNMRLFRLLTDQGIDVVSCVIGMREKYRTWNRENIENYREIYLKVSHDTLYRRDQKKLYSTKAKNVVGVDLPWDEPGHSSIVIQNDGQESPEEIVDRLMNFFGLE